MTYVPLELRQFVTQRAYGRCEYCRLSQDGQEATFHIDHIIPIAAGGQTDAGNLALACVSCSLRKAARQTVTDLESGSDVPVFNPRNDVWNDHFLWEGEYLLGLTAIGRALVDALDMNRPLIVGIRREEELLGRPPPHID